jgi:hypothetical protein
MSLKDKFGIQPELRNIVMETETNLAGGATLADTIAKLNALLAKLKESGLMKK